nr:cytochrome c-type biogenesis protein CcmH [Rickettsia endosymbiont of Ceutorhynchus assimilis]
MRAVVSLLFILIFHSGVNAFTLDNKLRDKSMEKRATSLFEIIRCPICSGESLSESGSQIAYDMREAIRKKINDGYTDEEIISELKKFLRQFNYNPHLALTFCGLFHSQLCLLGVF